MNSAVEPLLKAVNDLKNEVNMLQAEKRELIKQINELNSRVLNLESKEYHSPYSWSSDYVPTPYWRSVAERIRWIEDINNNSDWTLTITYADGRTETIGPTV